MAVYLLLLVFALWISWPGWQRPGTASRWGWRLRWVAFVMTAMAGALLVLLVAGVLVLQDRA